MDGLRSVSPYPRHDQISWRNTQSLGKDSSGNWTIGRGGKSSAPAEWVRESHRSLSLIKKQHGEVLRILQLNILAQTIKIGPPRINLIPEWCQIDHFWVPLGLCFKTRLSAQALIWKSFFILMQRKLISTRKVVHLASFWKWGFFELLSGLLSYSSEIPFDILKF